MTEGMFDISDRGAPPVSSASALSHVFIRCRCYRSNKRDPDGIGLASSYGSRRSVFRVRRQRPQVTPEVVYQRTRTGPPGQCRRLGEYCRSGGFVRGPGRPSSALARALPSEPDVLFKTFVTCCRVPVIVA